LPLIQPTPPSAATLRKYGVTAEQWLEILASQGNVCAICGKVPSTGRWVTDHAHVKGYKKLPDDQRRALIRGICCWWCNKTHLGRGITIDKAKAVVAYLQAFETRLSTRVS